MHYVHQDGQQVFKFAVRKQTELCQKLLERNGLKGSDIDAFIPHQANLRIINATADRLGLRPEAVIVNIDRYGNTTAGTIPLAMNTAIEEGKLKKGSLVMLASVGAGFTWAQRCCAGRFRAACRQASGREASDAQRSDRLTARPAAFP